jgi:hypothetical protein
MKVETMLAKAKEVSPAFSFYAQYMLEAVPNMNMPTLWECFKHNASASEYLATLERVREGKESA